MLIMINQFVPNVLKDSYTFKKNVNFVKMWLIIVVNAVWIMISQYALNVFKAL